MALYQHSIQLGDKGMRILRFPLVKLLIAFSIFAVGTAFASVLSDLFNLNVRQDGIKGWLFPLINTFLQCGFALLGYWLFVSLFEGRPLTELSRGIVKYNVIGIVLGVVLISLIMGALSLLGYYRIEGLNQNPAILQIMNMSIMAGIVEEILLRGYLYRIVEEGMGTWWSVVISALVFGFLHILNPNASFFSSLSIALTAGVVMALLFAITRNLWIVIGMHFAWNFTLGGLWGAPVSGGDVRGYFNGVLDGPELMTGGAFGPEASIIMIIVFIILGIYLVNRTIKSRQVVLPRWKRNK